MKRRTIKDVGIVLETIKNISDLDYQNNLWVNQNNPNIIDSYDDTTMYFLEEGEAALNAKNEDRIEMTDKQYDMLKKLYEMVEVYDMSKDRPDEDKDIINDPKWHKIKDYAKLVYKELMEK